jgi:hypothetical protein
MAWQPDPLLLRFLDAIEREFAWALEQHYRHRNAEPSDERSPGAESASIATLRRTIEAVQAALERPVVEILH